MSTSTAASLLETRTQWMGPEATGWRSDLPPGAAGEWRLERFAVRRGPVAPERLARLPGGLAYAWPAGTYTRLCRGETVFMTDTPDEWRSHRPALAETRRRGGHTLVTGLGLGLVVEAMLREGAESVLVVERSADVIELVGRHLLERHGDRLHVVCADAFAWEPPAGRHFTVAWHDVWERADPGVVPDMERLERRFRDRCDWQGSWPREYWRGMNDD